MTTEQTKWVLALLERKCPDCNWVEGYFVTRGTMTTICTHCKGTGRIPLLPGVREIGAHDICEGHSSCLLIWKLAVGDCHGLGITPTANFGKWLGELQRDGWAIYFSPNSGTDDDPADPRPFVEVEGIGKHPTGGSMDRERKGIGEDAFFAALVAATLPLAVNGDATMAWVREHIA